MLGKGTAGVVGHSYALIAEAIESGTDIFSSIIVWLGLRTAAREPDANHPYGHGKAEPLAAIAVAFALVCAAAYIATEGVLHILTPHQLPAPFTLAVLAVVIVIKETLYRRVNKVGEEVDSNAVKADAWHHRADVITSCTAFVGISIALIGGKGWESADDWAALVACCFIVYNAYHIFRPAFGEIMDELPRAPGRTISAPCSACLFFVVHTPAMDNGRSIRTLQDRTQTPHHKQVCGRRPRDHTPAADGRRKEWPHGHR